MRLTRIRFRLRTLMIAVAIVGIVSGGVAALGRLWQQARYGDYFRHYSEQERDAEDLSEELARRVPEDPDHFKYWSAYYANQARDYARNRRLIEREMRLPWEPTPDSRDAP